MDFIYTSAERNPAANRPEVRGCAAPGKHHVAEFGAHSEIAGQPIVQSDAEICAAGAGKQVGRMGISADHEGVQLGCRSLGGRRVTVKVEGCVQRHEDETAVLLDAA